MVRKDTLISVVTAVATPHNRKAPFSIVEIGVDRAGRTLTLAREAIRNRCRRIHYYAFDLFQDWSTEKAKAEFCRLSPPVSVDQFQHTIGGIVGVEYIRLIRGDVRETIDPSLALPKLDVIWVSGGHSEETTLACARLLPNLSAHGIAVFDNYYPDHADRGVLPVISELITTYTDFEFETSPSFDTLPSGDRVGPLKVRRR